jgi:hypothetical protein
VDFVPYPGVQYRHDYPAIFGRLSRLGDKHTSRAKKLSVYRELCRTDLFFLAYFGLGLHFIHSNYNVAKWYVDRCNQIDDDPDTNTLDLWFREGGKSVLNTLARGLREILKAPEASLGILCYNRDLAKDFLKSYMSLMEDPDTLVLRWFPEIFWKNPKKEAPSWSLENGLTLKTHTGQKEASIEGWGLVSGQPTGRHFNILVFDDLITNDMKDSPTQLAKAADNFRMSGNLGSSIAGPVKQWVSGTRYDYSDLYGEIIEGQEKGTEYTDWLVRVWPGEQEVGGETIYHCFDEAYFAKKRDDMGSSVYASQVLQNPIDPKAQFFKRSYASYWTVPDHHTAYCVTFVDPAGWEEHSKGDNTALITVERDEEGFYYVRTAEADRMRPSVTLDRVYEEEAKFSPNRRGVEGEKYGKSLLDRHETEMADRGALRIEEIKHRNSSKDSRIQTLQPLWEQRRIKMHPSMEQLRQEFFRYPGWRRKDLIDALAYAISMFPPLRPKNKKRKRRPVKLSRSRFGPR